MNYKKGENHMLNNMNQIYFINKECKNSNHFLCQYRWKGFGFEIICNCDCHNKTVLGKYTLDNQMHKEKTGIVKNSEEIGEFSK